MTESKSLCPASGTMLPDDVREDYLADDACTHFFCVSCGKQLALPRNPFGVVRKHAKAEAQGEPWPFAVEAKPADTSATTH
jgi:hypothetical protein